MATRAEWQKPLDDLKCEFDAIDPLYSGEDRVVRLAGIFGVMKGWGDQQRVFALGHLETRLVIELCRAEVAQWWEALAGSTYFGRLDDLRRRHAAMEEDPGKCTQKPDLSATMTWGAFNYSIAEGAPPALNGDVASQLFDWGADPFYKDNRNETYFNKALRGSPAGVIHAFLSHGAPGETAMEVRDELLRAGEYKQAREIQTGLGLGGFYAKVDNATVMETKYVTDAGRACVLRTVFNFGAQRINETFEIAGGAPAMASCNFADYSRNAIDLARDALEKLGGDPGPDIRLPDKPRRLGLGR